MSMQPTGSAPGGIPTYYTPPSETKPQKQEDELPVSSPQSPTEAVAEAASTTTDPRNAEALTSQELRRREVESLLSPRNSSDTGAATPANASAAAGTEAVAAVTTPSLPKDIAKQVSIITDITTKGIFTPAKCRKEGISATFSADKYPVDSQVCLNHVYSTNGIGISLTQAANGGLAVVMERPQESSAALNELSERVQHSFLVVMPIRKESSSEDALLNLVTDKGTEIRGGIYLPRNPKGCSETRANGSILPQNFAYILIPEHLQSHLGDLQFDRSKIIFVPNCTETIGNITITCPNYRQALERIFGQDGFKHGMLTHMLRCPTARDLS